MICSFLIYILLSITIHIFLLQKYWCIWLQVFVPNLAGVYYLIPGIYTVNLSKIQTFLNSKTQLTLRISEKIGWTYFSMIYVLSHGAIRGLSDIAAWESSKIIGLTTAYCRWGTWDIEWAIQNYILGSHREAHLLLLV